MATIKQQLLKMAKNNELRPSCRIGIGRKLGKYTSKNNPLYDEKFTRQLNELAPEWFIKKSADYKKMLLDIAREGKPKPSSKHRIGQYLIFYIRKHSKSYDEEFTKKINELAPEWFIDKFDNRKRILLNMAKEGKPRPSSKLPIGSYLCNCMKEDIECHAKFREKIRKLAPEWFADTMLETKITLVKMAIGKESRPLNKSFFGRALSRYTRKSSKNYDRDFSEQIRELAPEWFIDTSQEKKYKLLEMAVRGKPRPLNASPIGQSLVRYTDQRKNSYDMKFDKNIRELAPSWFKT